jgi:hypothetical protein
MFVVVSMLFGGALREVAHHAHGYGSVLRCLRRAVRTVAEGCVLQSSGFRQLLFPVLQLVSCWSLVQRAAFRTCRARNVRPCVTGHPAWRNAADTS